MTDTPRTRDYLLGTSFADGGPVTAQDMRDFVESVPVSVYEDAIYNPGDPGHAEVVFGLDSVSTADGATTYVTEGLFVAHHYAGTATDPIGVYGAHIVGVIDAEATTALYDVQGLFVEMKHFGESTANSLLGIQADLHVQDGAGAVNNAAAIYAVATNTETTTTLRALWATLEGQGGSATTNGRTIDILRPIGTAGFTNLTGLHIDDHSGIGSGANYNMFSKGVGSRNRFEGHSAFGPDAGIDQTILSGYSPSRQVVTLAEDFTDTVATSMLDTTLGIRARYDRSAAFSGGDYAPSVYGLTISAEWEATTGTDGVNNNDLLGVNVQAVLKASATMPPYVMYGMEGAAVIESGAPAMTTRASGMSFGLVVLGSSPSAPITGETGSAAEFLLNTGRTGTYELRTVDVRTPVGGGNPSTVKGVRIGAHTNGTAESWNLFSEGTTSKNKFQGRVFAGTPNSAPTDADIDNGMVTAYLDQAGNALKFRVRYSDGTLKTGSVSLT